MSGCWLWTAHIAPTGYGMISFRRGPHGSIPETAHRVSYRLFRGEILDGMHVCHTCDNRACVNPAHLWVGSRTDNMRDMVKKGRHASKVKSGYMPSGAAHYTKRPEWPARWAEIQAQRRASKK